jgi:hypothetical protein
MKPDFEEVLERYEAWWECAIVDRPLVSISFFAPREEWAVRFPQREHSSFRDRWMDTEYAVRQWDALLSNQVHFADSLPVAWPNLGPDVFASFYGCPLEYDAVTSWSRPVLEDWTPSSIDDLRLDMDGFTFRKVMELTDALIEAGREKFIVGYTDLHAGGDAIAALRGPENLCIDMIEHADEIRSLCHRITDDFLAVFDIFHRKLSAAGMPSTTWLPATCRGRLHVPSNDFSCMISHRMFEETFLPVIVRECRHVDRCIYHLDGPMALRYLDTLLEVPEIQAVQWVSGAGRDYWADWIDVYQKIQSRGKAIQILSIPAADLNRLFEVLRPEGVWISQVSGIETRGEAESALKAISRWGRGPRA